jgi:hypothetical protein
MVHQRRGESQGPPATLGALRTPISSAPNGPHLQSHRPTLGTSHGESPRWGTGLHQDGTRLTREALFLHDPNDAFHRSNRLDSAVRDAKP